LPSSSEQLLDGFEESLDKGMIPARIFGDPELHELELDRIFTRAWCYIGHDSEIPSPGDYCVRYIGEDAFIFVRDENGEVRVLFDSCRHRGTKLCRAEQGNASHFRCPYHGWTFKNTGEFVGAPAYREAYGEFDRSKWGLFGAAKVDSVHGLYFATLDPDAPSLDEYLGGVKWYLELMLGLGKEGMKVRGEPQRWVMDGNWKTAAENFVGDDYHTLFLHKSMWDLGIVDIPQRELMDGYHIQAGNGHNLSFSMATAEEKMSEEEEFFGWPKEISDTFSPDGLTPEQYEVARRARVCVGTVFPNFSFLMMPLTPTPKSSPATGFMTVRVWQPRGHDKIDIWSWYLVWEGSSEAFAELSYKAGMGTFSSSGLFEQDDSVPWESVMRTGATAFGRKIGLEYNFQRGLPGTGTASELVESWPGPGIATWPRFDEALQRSLYRRWHQFMTSAGYPANTD
jgi:phenylpropionate dioxygenase-like ring-hydroxylating dioxygenase large terminal subunit